MAVAAQAMRRILVDHARGRGAAKRGGGVENLTFDEELTISAEPPSIDLIALDQSLERLQARQPEKAAVVEMRFFGGLTDDEIASVLGVSSRTVVRYWKYAQAWLYRDLRDSG
jgi:RNA polymerase sigma factor (TIGR02999 family)